LIVRTKLYLSFEIFFFNIKKCGVMGVRVGMAPFWNRLKLLRRLLKYPRSQRSYRQTDKA